MMSSNKLEKNHMSPLPSPPPPLNKIMGDSLDAAKNTTSTPTTAAQVQQLPDLNDTDKFKLNPDSRANFLKNGHVLLRNICTADEIEPYRRVIIDATQRNSTEERFWQAFVQVLNLWQKDDGVKKFTHAKRFGKIAADLMGVENVRLYHDQSLFKEPGGKKTPWHYDQYYWPVDTENIVTMWMPLVDISTEMGLLTFASGSHKLGEKLLELHITDNPDEFHGIAEKIIEENKFPVTRAEGGTMKAGDATFHRGWTLHSAPPNTSQKTREVMTIIWVADGAKVIEPKNPNQLQDTKWWMDGKQPGELVNGPLNTLIL